MKKIIKSVSILFLIIVTLAGCSGSDESKAKKVAEEFVRTFYTVDAQKVEEYRKLDGQIPPGISMIGEGVPKGSKSGPNEEYTKIMDSLDKSIKSLTTEKEYESLISSNFNLSTTRICDDGNYTCKVTDFTLGKNVYEEKDEKVRYHYEAKLKFTSTVGKAEELDEVNGAIELLKENGKWKVWMYTITKYPKFYK